MEGKGPDTPAPGPQVETPSPRAAVKTGAPPVETDISKQLDQAIGAAEAAEVDLKGQGPDAALEGLAHEGGEIGPPGEAQPEQADNGQPPEGAEGPTKGEQQEPGTTQDPNGDQAQGQEGQQEQPETMEQQVTRLQEQVGRLTEQNQQLTTDLTKLSEGLKAFLEKAEAEEQVPAKKLKYKDLLLIIAALAVITVVEGGKQVGPTAGR